MIKGFGSKSTQKIWERTYVKKLPKDIQERGRKKLMLIDAAESLNDLRVPPGNRLEQLRGERKEQHAIRINDQWRICFIWDSGDAYAVEIVGYH